VSEEKAKPKTLRDLIDDSSIECPNCRGKGSVVVYGVRPLPNHPQTMECPVCVGTGKVIE